MSKKKTNVAKAQVYDQFIKATAMLKCVQLTLDNSEAATEDDNVAGAALALLDCISRLEDLQMPIHELEHVPNHAARTIAPKPWNEGIDLALELIDQADSDEMTLEDSIRDGRPQDNRVYAYVRKARLAGEQQLVAFCAVLSDFISGAADGSVADTELLERLARRPVADEVANA